MAAAARHTAQGHAQRLEVGLERFPAAHRTPVDRASHLQLAGCLHDPVGAVKTQTALIPVEPAGGNQVPADRRRVGDEFLVNHLVDR